MTLDEIMSISPEQLNKMSAKELKSVVSRLNDAANKRMRRIETSGQADYSLAYQSRKAKTKDMTFSIKGIGGDVNKARAKFSEVRDFLGNKTSSVSGTKAYRKSVYKSLGGDFGGNKAKEKLFYKNFRKALENDAVKSQIEGYGSDKVRQAVYNAMYRNGKGEYISAVNRDAVANIGDYEIMQIAGKMGVSGNNMDDLRTAVSSALTKENKILDIDTLSASKIGRGSDDIVYLMGAYADVKYREQQSKNRGGKV